MISVCMAAYNGEKYIRKQIDSILCQLSDDDELIISDNGSTDRTREIVESYNDKRIKYLEYITDEKNKFYRVTLNFNNSLIHARGDYIFLADQDDIWSKDKVSIMIKDLLEHPCVISNYVLIDFQDKVISDSKFNSDPLKHRMRSFIKMPFLGCTMAFTGEFLRKYCLPFPDKLILHDLWIGLIAYLKRDMYFEEDCLHFYRMHGDNVTTASSGRSRNSLYFKISYRINLYKDVISRIIKTKRL